MRNKYCKTFERYSTRMPSNMNLKKNKYKDKWFGTLINSFVTINCIWYGLQVNDINDKNTSITTNAF